MKNKKKKEGGNAAAEVKYIPTGRGWETVQFVQITVCVCVCEPTQTDKFLAGFSYCIRRVESEKKNREEAEAK